MRDLMKLAACLLCAAVILAGCRLSSGTSGKDRSDAGRTEEQTETEHSSRTRRSSSSDDETSSPEQTPAPEKTGAPEGTAAPEKTSAPEQTAVPEKTAAPEQTPAPGETPDAGSPEVFENRFFRVTMPGPWQDRAVFREIDDRTAAIDCGAVPLAVIGVDAPADYLRGDVYIAWSAPYAADEDVYVQVSSVFYALVYDEMTEEERKALLLMTTGGAYTAGSVGFEDADALFGAMTPYYEQILVPGIEILTPAGQETPAPSDAAFYGIWCLSSRERADAQRLADTLAAAGWPAEVIDTSEWDGLNDGWYSVTVGRYATQESADAALASVREAAGEAYVKFSGEPVSAPH